MKIAVFILLLLFCTNAFAQSGYMKIETLRSGKDLTFPAVICTDKDVQYKINTYLQLTRLNLLIGSDKGDIFERVNETIVGRHSKLNASHFKVLCNSPKALSFVFVDTLNDNHTYTNYYNFNPQNGDLYYIEDFFGEENLARFKEIFTNIRYKNLLQLEANNYLLKADRKALEEIKTEIETDNFKTYYFYNNYLVFDNYALPKYNNQTIKYDSETLVDFNDLTYLLNDYGKAVLLGSESIKERRSVSGSQLYEGKLSDGGKFLMTILNPDAQTPEEPCLAIYTFLNYGIGTYLEGNLIDNKYYFHDINSFKFSSLSIEMKQEGDELKGTWNETITGNATTFIAKRK
jgi:hypothetical protein